MAFSLLNRMKLPVSYILVFVIAMLLIFSGIATYIHKTAVAAIAKNITGKDVPPSYYTTRYWFGEPIPDTRYARGKELLNQQ